MTALSSPATPAFSSIGWSLFLEEPLNLKDTETSDEYPFPHHHQVDTCTSSPSNTNTNIGKTNKFNHNASERDRRKKISTLYSSLHSLLPLPQRQMKKVSIPATISMVVKYIPELEQEVEGLVKKKEELLLIISRHRRPEASVSLNNKESQRNSVCVVSTIKLNDYEAVIQISSYKIHNLPLSHILHFLEQDFHNNVFLLNASSFHTFHGRLFHHLHFQVENCCRLEWDEIITEKLLSIYEKKEEVF